ncbi:hypothetical protein EV360DRAFT_75742 [Lentinula raphanica]|nr:hypothetical protein EV360DRAFT_75742 [Lentinula raphanica]
MKQAQMRVKGYPCASTTVAFEESCKKSLLVKGPYLNLTPTWIFSDDRIHPLHTKNNVSPDRSSPSTIRLLSPSKLLLELYYNKMRLSIKNIFLLGLSLFLVSTWAMPMPKGSEHGSPNTPPGSPGTAPSSPGTATGSPGSAPDSVHAPAQAPASPAPAPAHDPASAGHAPAPAHDSAKAPASPTHDSAPASPSHDSAPASPAAASDFVHASSIDASNEKLLKHVYVPEELESGELKYFKPGILWTLAQKGLSSPGCQILSSHFIPLRRNEGTPIFFATSHEELHYGHTIGLSVLQRSLDPSKTVFTFAFWEDGQNWHDGTVSIGSDQSDMMFKEKAEGSDVPARPKSPGPGQAEPSQAVKSQALRNGLRGLLARLDFLEALGRGLEPGLSDNGNFTYLHLKVVPNTTSLALSKDQADYSREKNIAHKPRPEPKPGQAKPEPYHQGPA